MTLLSGVNGNKTYLFTLLPFTKLHALTPQKYCGLANWAGPSAEAHVFGSQGQEEFCRCCCMCAAGCHPGLALMACANRPLHLLLLPAELRERREMLCN